MKTMFRMAFLAAPIFLSACGTLVNGPAQSVLIDASPAISANVICVADNGRGVYNVPMVPMHIQVERSRGPLNIRCNSSNGWRGATTVSAVLDPAPTIGSVAVALPTSARDFRNGSVWGYPASVVVPMTPPAVSRTVQDAVGGPIQSTATSSAERPVRAVRRVRHHRASGDPSK